MRVAPTGTCVPESFLNLLRGALHSPPDARVEAEITQVFATNKIGKYEIALRADGSWDELGAGAQAVVYRALDKNLGRSLALKVIGLNDGRGAYFRGMLADEGRSLARLRHNHVVTVYEADSLGPLFYLAMELCESGSLADWLNTLPAKQMLPAEWIVELMRQIAAGVSAAHDSRPQILHRDLKPGNILLTRSEGDQLLQRRHRKTPDDLPHLHAKVADFGLSMILEAGSVSHGGAGTLAYMPPEQYRGGELTPASDVYSLGAIFYELLARQRPFGGTREEIERHLQNLHEPAPLKRLRPDLPRGVVEICERCLSTAPARRPANAGVLAAELQEYVERQQRQKFTRRAALVAGCSLVPILAAGTYKFSDELHRQRQRLLLRALPGAEPVSLPALVRELDLNVDFVRNELGRMWNDTASTARLNAAAVLAPRDAKCLKHVIEDILSTDLEQARNIGYLTRALEGRVPELSKHFRAALAPPQSGATQSDAVRETNSRRRANAATALILSGDEAGWGLFAFAPDCEARSFLVHTAGPAGVQPRVFLQQIRNEPDVSVRRALILALGEVPVGDWIEAEIGEAHDLMLKLYRDDPDSGVHGAAKWFLRNGSLVRVDRDLFNRWHKERANEDKKLQALGVRQGFNWWIGPLGLTLVRLNVENDEGKFLRRIEISDSEVTIEQFEEFARECPREELCEIIPEARQYESLANCPMNSVSYRAAAMLCNWMTSVAPETRSDANYYTCREKGPVRVSGTPNSRWGYRMPEDCDFESAMRAGTSTMRYYGDSPMLADSYAWCTPSARPYFKPVALLKPNDQGLFDTLGNVAEWGDSTLPGFPTGKHIFWGRAFTSDAYWLGRNDPNPEPCFDIVRYLFVGFRVCRTIALGHASEVITPETKR